MTLLLIPVDALPVAQAGFIDCRDIGCAWNAIRLRQRCTEQAFLNCYACRQTLVYQLGSGWKLKPRSREEIARRREAAREKYAPVIGSGWEELRKMQKSERLTGDNQ